MQTDSSHEKDSERRRGIIVASSFWSILIVIGTSIIVATNKWRPSSWAALGAIGALLQAVGVLIALVYGFGSLSETRKLRLEQVRPFVVIDIDATSPPMYFLELANLGSIVARNVRITFDPELRTTGDASWSISKTRFLYEPIPTFVPGKRFRTFFDSGIQLANSDLPKRYEAIVTYEADDGRIFSDTYVLDFDMYLGATYISKKGIKDVSKHLEEIAKSLRSFQAHATGGVKVVTPAELCEERRKMLEEWEAERAERAVDESSGDA